ncbi:DNA-binding transcriptional activator GcvA [Pseudooctadecabacter jejudonensis]|uniref:DNA-binding transcriptional activator GcvA n=2 Tax=Pseudooctadecabacter jejudonensis TaxID=1391910 RepID=A0A1Y5S6S2_9RHOB|nr:DNA-binding transcriptional activator GcvA [Pseudooctadecabacter jejudonensis]
MAAGHVAVAAPSYIGDRPVTCLGDLKGSRWVVDGMRSEERMWIAENGIDLNEETVTQFPTSQFSREAALSGLGITVLPAPIADQLERDGKVIKLCEEENSDIAYHILTRPEIVSPTRDVFVKWLRAAASL